MKISIVGGGSYCWTPTLFRDIICTPGLEGAEIVLEDINRRHLDDLHRCCGSILRQLGKTREFRLRATMNLTQALRGADYVILTITTGGLDAMAHDIDIPSRYGIYQPVGDTVGPGGIARALRNIPVVVGLAKQMERHCPKAWLLNITNPMSVLTRCVGRETAVRCVGLCHELYGTLARVERMLGATDWRKDFDCVSVGVNHLPWVISLKYKGQDAFPILRKALANGKVPGTNKPLNTVLDHTFQGAGRVKFDLFKAFDALPAAGDRHLVEFFPYFCTAKTRRGAGMGVKLTTIARRRVMAANWRKQVARITAGKELMEAVVSQESTARVIAGLAGLMEWKDVVNLPNAGQVPELPRDVVVETMGIVTRDHIYGLPVGKVPPALLTQIERHVSNQELTVEAAVTGDRQLTLQAFLNDPLCGAIGDFRKMETMMNEMLTANRQWLPQFFSRRASARP